VSIAQFRVVFGGCIAAHSGIGKYWNGIATIVSYFVSVPYLVLALKKEVV